MLCFIQGHHCLPGSHSILQQSFNFFSTASSTCVRFQAMSMLRQHHLPGPAMLRRPLRHGPYVMSSEGLVIHLGQLTPLTPADSTVQRPAVSSRGSVNGVCHTAAQIFHILPQILAANRLDAPWRRANLAPNKEVSLVKWHFRRHVPHFSHSVLVPVA